MAASASRMHGALLVLGERRIDTLHGAFRALLMHDLSVERAVLALVRGNVTTDAGLLSRVHSSCVTSEMLGACDCDCAEQLDAALEAIDREGRGVVFYLMQEGRGAGLAAKASDRMIVQASEHRVSTFEAYEELGLAHDGRRYGAVRAALALLGVRAPLRLLTNNPEKRFRLEAEKIPVDACLALERGASAFNAHYLGSKRASGHALSPQQDLRADLPGAVERISPQAVGGEAALYRLARYWLPVQRGRRLAGSEASATPCWLRLTLYLDVARRAELVLLEWPGDAAGALPFYAFGESVFERLPLRDVPMRRRWNEVLEHFEARGAGLAVFAPLAAQGAADARERPDPQAVAAVVRDRVAGPGTLEMLAPLDLDEGALVAALEERGLRVKAAQG